MATAWQSRFVAAPLIPLTRAQFASEVVVSDSALAIALPTITQLPGVRSSVATVEGSGALARMKWLLNTVSAYATELPPGAAVTSPAGPWGPCGPTGPIGPIGPTTPAIPWRPEGPTSPCGPCGPTGPATPAGPCGPTGPATPEGPCGPTSPFNPCGPTGPKGPIGPVGPTGPASPAGPWMPTPCGPAGPIGPGGPAGPATLVQLGSEQRASVRSVSPRPHDDWLEARRRTSPSSLSAHRFTMPALAALAPAAIDNAVNPVSARRRFLFGIKSFLSKLGAATLEIEPSRMKPHS